MVALGRVLLLAGAGLAAAQTIVKDGEVTGTDGFRRRKLGVC